MAFVASFSRTFTKNSFPSLKHLTSRNVLRFMVEIPNHPQKKNLMMLQNTGGYTKRYCTYCYLTFHTQLLDPFLLITMQRQAIEEIRTCPPPLPGSCHRLPFSLLPRLAGLSSKCQPVIVKFSLKSKQRMRRAGQRAMLCYILPCNRDESQ